MTRTIEELKAIEQAATMGPWEFELDGPDNDRLRPILGLFSPGIPVCTDRFVLPWIEERIYIRAVNATFITEARTAMPELIAEVESLRQQRDELLDELKDLVEINNWTPKSWETRLRVLRNIIQRCEVKG